MKAILYFILFLLGATAILGIRYVMVLNNKPFTAGERDKQLDPPRNALTGVLTDSDGKVEHLLRENDDYQDATPGGIIRQGEVFKTDLNSSASVTLAQDYTLYFRSGAEANFANLVPPNVLVAQRSGTIDYQVELDKPPLSVRAKGALVEIIPGNTIISVEEDTIIVYVFSGAAKIGVVDSNNNTYVYDVPQESRAVVNNLTGSVRFE